MKVKTVEGRLNKGKFKNIKGGDIITFTNPLTKKSIALKVESIKEYKSFENMISMEGIKHVLPD